MSIVDLHEVKRHLHYADDSNDVSLKSFIVAADAIIKNYITDNFGSEYPSAIKQACLLYPYDAADDMKSEDIRGSRINKKK